MDKLSTFVFDTASKFEKYTLSVFAQQTSAQPADIKATVAPALGLVKKGMDYEFDVNSGPANKIFGPMEKAEFKGDMHIHLTVDANKKGTLSVVPNPSNAQSKAIATQISAALSPSVNAALAKMKVAPAEPITIEDIVTASL